MLLGAHVSTAGGVRNALVRAAEIGATAIQIFTKQPSRWAEPVLDAQDVGVFLAGIRSSPIRFTCAHDSYLINLASADPVLRERSYESFAAELARAARLGLQAVVTHPGNATDGDRGRGIVQNSELIERALASTPGETIVLLETTAGSGNALGSSFEELAELRDRVSPELRQRVGVCFDTCHVFAAGYDLRSDYDGVMAEFDRVIGLPHLRLFHLNDSLKPLASRRDRHAEIGEGELGDEPFARIMCDPRFEGVPKVLETPKGDDATVADLRNLRRLIGLAARAQAPRP